MNALARATVTSAIYLLSGLALAESGGRVAMTAASGELAARGPDGSVLWRVQLPDSDTLAWERTGDGSVVLDRGIGIDEFGRVFGRLHDAVRGPDGGEDGPRAGCPYWSALAQLTPAPGSGQSDSHNVPLFDSVGNAWVVLTHIDAGAYALQLRRSNGHDGTWLPVETLSDTTRYVSGPEGVIDSGDNITIVFRDIGGGYKLYAMRYEPGAGWAGPDLAYSTGTFFQAVEAAADHEGNVVAVFDPDNTVWSVVRDATTGTWGAAAQVSPVGYQTMLPTVVQNRAGDAVYLIYMVRGGGPAALYAHRFDSSTKTWGPPEFLPDSETVSFSAAGPASRFPATVGPRGEATVFWQSSAPYGVYANRTQDGVWRGAHRLLAPGPDDADLENFAHASSSEFDDAFGTITRYESGSVHFYVFRYRPGSGWDEPENPHTFAYNITTRSRIEPYRGAYAVGTLFAFQDGTAQLTSMLYDGSDWLPGLVDIPSDYPAFMQEIASDRGEPLLVFEAEELIGANYGIFATWLRNLPGDLTSDGVVDLADLATLLGSYELDAGGDVDGDGDTDLGDLAALLANYERVCP